MKSIWKDYSPNPVFLTLSGSIDVDVAIIGGGITGIMSAYVLSQSGKKVAVLESYEVGGGTTAFSTGNLYSMTDKRMHHIQSHFSIATLSMVLESRTAAINLIESLCLEYKIPCNFKRMPWYLYSETESEAQTVKKERKALVEAGLGVRDLTSLSLPYNIYKAIKVENQAQFNPAAFVKSMAEIIQSKKCLIYAHTPMQEISEKSPFVITTPGGEVVANAVIMATHTPKGIYPVQTSLGPYREYALACTLKSGDYPEGIFWSTQAQHHISVRSFKTESKFYLLVIGESHKVGQAENDVDYFSRLEYVAREKFDIDTIDYKWSAQHYKPADGLPYIGESLESGIYIATGFSTDGLVYGTLSGMILSDLINGRENPWARMYKPKRFTPVASAGKFLKENVNVAGEYLKDIFGKTGKHPILKGEGKIVEHEGEKLAVFNDQTGQLHAVSAVCPHMKCIVNWNNLEKTWDCPCHGSRFKITGEIIEGPSLDPLKKKVLKPDN